MTVVRRVPPGRAGRLWVLGRLRSGRLAANLLDRKLAILRADQQRLQLRVARTGERWRTCWQEADRWAARGAMLGTEREARLSGPTDAVEVDLGWATAMGVRYPVEARCRFPVRSATDRGPGTAALVEAGPAFVAAVQAAADHAAAEAAVRIIDDEVAVTRRRLRAIKDRWVPQLESTLDRLERDLDESEREATFRLRWAMGATGSGVGRP
jgi:V/A-type H+-transporting ATPase subunit D